ncbi:MAG: hypothetical protein GY832_11485 [Chloroflexi bacterium]|nr:hypothetical protein [Chloroflexota bacterium]
MPTNTHCPGYYQHECGVPLTTENRHYRATGKCYRCGSVTAAALRYKRIGKDVPKRIHALAMRAEKQSTQEQITSNMAERDAELLAGTYAELSVPPFTFVDGGGDLPMLRYDNDDESHAVELSFDDLCRIHKWSAGLQARRASNVTAAFLARHERIQGQK